MEPIRLDRSLLRLLRGELRHVAGDTITAVRREVPSYAGPLSGEMGANIEAAVQMALAGFLRLADHGLDVDPGTPLSPTLDGAYALGRGEARSGRTADALLTAYRVGARVAWRELAAIAVANGVEPADIAAFAELVFAYIDALSAASLAGHADELATSGRVRERYLDLLGRALLTGESVDDVQRAADRAGWRPPQTLTAVLLPQAHVRTAFAAVELAGFDVPLTVPGDLPDLGEPSGENGDADEELAVLLVPEAHGPARERLLAALSDRAAIVGPSRPWLEARSSYGRAVRTRCLGLGSSKSPVDTDVHLPRLVLTADAEALADLRALTLAPLESCRPSTREKLIETLRAWLLHQGRRDEVASALFVHPQTVRYRMGQLRELFGDRLDDPDSVLALTLAVGAGGVSRHQDG